MDPLIKNTGKANAKTTHSSKVSTIADYQDKFCRLLKHFPVAASIKGIGKSLLTCSNIKSVT